MAHSALDHDRRWIKIYMKLKTVMEAPYQTHIEDHMKRILDLPNGRFLALWGKTTSDPALERKLDMYSGPHGETLLRMAIINLENEENAAEK